MKSTALETYIEKNKRKVLLLLDGLDESSIDITNAQPEDDIVGIIRGERLKRTPVLVTTRQWRANQITTIDAISNRYTSVRVEGFKRKNVKDYVKKFFEGEENSSQSLIKLMTDDSLVAQEMAPYPIFCCMLCHLWKRECKRSVIQKLETFSQLFDEMIQSLEEQFAAKSEEKGESHKSFKEQCGEMFIEIGKVALHGLLSKQFSFPKESFRDCLEAMETGCGVGVLTAKTAVVPKPIKHVKSEKVDEHVTISFPHKLLQEYLAGCYLANLLKDDPAKFEELVETKILTNPEEFRYLLYFTASRKDNDVGKELLKLICSKVKDENLIADVAFECHNKGSLTPVMEFFQRKSTLKLSLELSVRLRHTWTAYVYILSVCKSNLVS